MPRLVYVFALTSVCTCTHRVSAQSVHALSASLTAEGTPVGEVADVPLRLEAWRSPDRAEVSFGDRVVTWRAELTLRDARTYVVAGVGADTVVRGTGPWPITMRAQTWAPLAGHAEGALVVALPDGLPARYAAMPPDARPARRPPRQASFTSPAPRGQGTECIPTRIFATRALQTSFEVPTQAFARRVSRERALSQWEIELSGFVVRGFAPNTQPCEPRTIALGSVSTMCSDGFTDGRVVTLPRATALFATATSTTPFGTLRAPHHALEPSAGAGLASSTGSEWILPFERHGIFHVYVRALASALPDARGAAPAFGLCRQPPADWPETHAPQTFAP